MPENMTSAPGGRRAAACDRWSVGPGFALGLAAVAGWVDATAFVRWSGLFVSFMSGNSTALAASLFDAVWSTTAPVSAVLRGLVAGVVCGEWIARLGGRWGHALLLLAESALLFTAAGVSAIVGAAW